MAERRAGSAGRSAYRQAVEWRAPRPQRKRRPAGSVRRDLCRNVLNTPCPTIEGFRPTTRHFAADG